MNTLSEVLADIRTYSHLFTPEEKDKIAEILNSIMPPVDVWMQGNFFIPELNGPIELYPHQVSALREGTRRDDEGNFVYDLVMWSDIKKSAKTTIGGARVLYSALTQPFANCRVIGNDLDQAKSRMFASIKDCLKLNKKLVEDYEITFTDASRDILIGALNSKISAVPVDPSGEAGGGDDLVAYTELWGFQSSAHVNVWAETTLSPLKRGKSQRWCESYAGFTGKSVVLENIYDQSVTHGKEIPNPDGYEWYTDAGETMFVMWNTVPRLPWQTSEYYRSEKSSLDDPSFSRMHRNQWASSQERFIQSDHYLEACLEDDPIEIEYGDVVYLAADAAVMRDSYGIVGVKHNVITDMMTVVTETELVATFGEIDLGEGEATIRAIAAVARVVVLTYDPTQLESTAQRLSKPLRDPNNPLILWPKVPVHRFTQVSKRVVADTALLDRIKGKNIRMYRNSRVVAHLRNADAKVIEDRKLRLVKRTQKLKIDLAVALSMACYVAEHAKELKLIVPDPTPPQSGGQRSNGARMDEDNRIETRLPSSVGESLPKEVGF